MIRLITILFFCTTINAFGQHLTEVKSIDTINVTGRILFIDSLYDMTPNYRMDINPYYLVLIEVNNIKGTEYWDSRLVYRTTNIDSIVIGSNLTVDLKMTSYDSIGIRNPDESISENMDSLLNHIDKIDLYFFLMEKRPTRDYSLKEKLYHIFEKIE